jgi:hypothetical protein
MREIADECSTVLLLPGSPGLLGCARVVGINKCDVYIAHDELLLTYHTTYDATYRHERSHCNDYQHDVLGKNWYDPKRIAPAFEAKY